MTRGRSRGAATADRLIVTCEHGGNKIPASYKPHFSRARTLLDSHRGYDIGALDLARALARHFNAPLIASTTSRLLVDLNRSLHHRQVFSDVSRQLAPQQREEIVRRHYTPYRDRVVAAIQRDVARGHRVLHIGVHTFTPVLDKQIRTADIALLYDPGRAGERTLCAAWCRLIRQTGPSFRVRRNYPYRGNNDGLTTTLRTMFPRRRYLGIEIEINQKWMLEKGLAADQIRTLVPETLGHLIQL